MSIMLLCASVLLLFLGHFFKIMRWKQFVEVYEQVGRRLLIRSLACGYLVNFLLPLRIGDLARAVWAGRRMENGVSFSLATVVIDRCLDVWVVGLLFLIMRVVGVAPTSARKTITFYIVLAAGLFLLLALATRFSKPVKRLAKTVCAIFNDGIRLTLLAFLWSGITAIKDMVQRLDKKRLACNSIAMWLYYLASYYVMSLAFQSLGHSITFFQLFSLLFESGQLNVSTLSLSHSVGGRIDLFMAVYILAPLLFLLLLSVLPGGLAHNLDKLSGTETGPMSVLHLLPQVSTRDKLQFLDSYFEAENRDYLDQYINLNRDIRILEDFSAGSNATTMLCMDAQSTFYRKYAFGRDAGKLQEQIDWLERHQQAIPLPEILRKQLGEGYCCYDMAYHPTALGLFQYLHSAEASQCWSLLETALKTLHENVHQKSIRPADPVCIEQYIDQKVWGNLRKIESSRELSPLLKYETLVINGRNYKNLPLLKEWLKKSFLLKIFKEDDYADIHGDLTIENIIYWRKEDGISYYFIDPNTGNLHESPFLDYSKLLQSLHGGYEFLMRTTEVNVDANRINFMFTLSWGYRDMFQRYRLFLEKTFSPSHVRSIYFHEIVHWLRLLPYKIEKNGNRAILFYAGLIMVFNDIIDWYGDWEQ